MSYAKNVIKFAAVVAVSGTLGYAAYKLLFPGNARRNPGPGKTAVIGDSITAKRDGYVRMLNEALIGRTFVNMGVVSEGTRAIKQRLERDVFGRDFDEVIIAGGANDLHRADAQSYIVTNLQAMVQAAKAQGLKVVLLTLPPWSRRASRIININKSLKRSSRSWGADVVVDIHQALSTPIGGLSKSFIGDRMGLHPNLRGHEKIAEKILKTAYN